MKDAWGQELEPGDIVVYPSRTGSAMWLVRAVVTAVVKRKRHWTAAEEEETVKVRRLCEARYGQTHPAEDQQKEFVIEAPERVTKVGRRF